MTSLEFRFLTISIILSLFIICGATAFYTGLAYGCANRPVARFIPMSELSIYCFKGSFAP